MDPKDFEELKAAVEEMAAVHRGEVPAHRSRLYSGQVLVLIREKGEVVWSLEVAAEALQETLRERIFDSPADFIKTIRAGLDQTQVGFAELLGISLRTLQGWEQGRRTPDESALRLIRVAAKYPAAVLNATEPEIVFA